MNDQSYQVMKHFNVRSGMPIDVWNRFVEVCNECLPGDMRRFYVYGLSECKFMRDYQGGQILWQDGDLIIERGDCIASDWFMDNGAEFGETVIAEY